MKFSRARGEASSFWTLTSLQQEALLLPLPPVGQSPLPPFRPLQGPFQEEPGRMLRSQGVMAP